MELELKRGGLILKIENSNRMLSFESEKEESKC